jgi:hypothetical protein
MKFKHLLTSTLLALSLSSNLRAADGDTVNIGTSPLLWLVGVMNAQADFRLTDEFTLGPVGSYYTRKSSGVKVSSYGLGVRANWFITGPVFTDSWYIGPSVSYMGAEASQDGTEASLNLWALQILGGYHWFWDSGFNLNVGAGGNYINWPEYVTVNGKRISLDTYENMNIAIEFNLGWSF